MNIYNTEKFISKLQENLFIELNRTFSPKIPEQYIQTISDNIFQKTPNNLFERVVYYICLNFNDMLLLVTPNTDIRPYREIICDMLNIYQLQVYTMLSTQEYSSDKIINDFILHISKNNVVLDSALRLSERLRNFLYQKTNSFIQLVLKNGDLVNEMIILNNEVKLKHPTPQLVCPEFYNALEKVCAYMNLVIQLTIAKTISESSGTNNSKLSISVEKKK